MVYAFETLKEPPPKGQVVTLKKLWQFDFDPSGPKENVHQYNKNSREGPSNFYGMPVFSKIVFTLRAAATRSGARTRPG